MDEASFAAWLHGSPECRVEYFHSLIERQDTMVEQALDGDPAARSHDSDRAPNTVEVITNATTRRSCRRRTNKKRILPARDCSASNSSGRWCACSPSDNGQALTPLPLVETHSATGVAVSEFATGICERRGLEEVGIAASTHNLVESAQISPNALEVKVGMSSAYTNSNLGSRPQHAHHHIHGGELQQRRGDHD